MKLKKHGHILSFQLEDRELNAPHRMGWRFIENLKKNIPPEGRDYDPETNTWSIDEEYWPALAVLTRRYLGGEE